MAKPLLLLELRRKPPLLHLLLHLAHHRLLEDRLHLAAPLLELLLGARHQAVLHHPRDLPHRSAPHRKLPQKLLLLRLPHQQGRPLQYGRLPQLERDPLRLFLAKSMITRCLRFLHQLLHGESPLHLVLPLLQGLQASSPSWHSHKCPTKQ